jgi:hypothetical protein
MESALNRPTSIPAMARPPRTLGHQAGGDRQTLQQLVGNSNNCSLQVPDGGGTCTLYCCAIYSLLRCSAPPAAVCRDPVRPVQLSPVCKLMGRWRRGDSQQPSSRGSHFCLSYPPTLSYSVLLVLLCLSRMPRCIGWMLLVGWWFGSVGGSVVGGDGWGWLW